MNLHGLASGVIGAVNPNIKATVIRSDGYTTAPSGKRTPNTVTTPNVDVQVQGVAAKELQHLNSLNIQGVLRSVHMNGDWRGIQRATGSGGDSLQFNNQTWLVVWVYETWPDWSRVIVAMQQ
jgi:hypothetical protein